MLMLVIIMMMVMVKMTMMMMMMTIKRNRRGAEFACSSVTRLSGTSILSVSLIIKSFHGFLFSFEDVKNGFDKMIKKGTILGNCFIFLFMDISFHLKMSNIDIRNDYRRTIIGQIFHIIKTFKGGVKKIPLLLPSSNLLLGFGQKRDWERYSSLLQSIFLWPPTYFELNIHIFRSLQVALFNLFTA